MPIVSDHRPIDRYAWDASELTARALPSPVDDGRSDPVTERVAAFSESLGIELTPDIQPDLLARRWATLTDAGVEAPGLAFALWSAAGGVAGPLLPILSNCPDVGALLDRLERFHPLFGRDRVVFETNHDSAWLSLEDMAGGPAHPDSVDACFALLCRSVSQLTAGGVRPDRVRLRRRAPVDDRAYRERFHDVRFGAARDRCEFDPATLAAPIVGADPVILSMLEPHAERLASRTHTRWAAEVGHLVSHRLATQPTLAEVAAQLAMSTRSLQHHLHAEGTTFSAVVDAAQREHALALIDADNLPITTIAAEVGFATPAGFTRAVRRWTGQTPSQRRSRHGPVG